MPCREVPRIETPDLVRTESVSSRVWLPRPIANRTPASCLWPTAPGPLNSDYPPNSENPGPSRLLSPVRSRVPGTFLAPPAREPIGRQIDLGYDLLKRIYSTI